MRPALKRNILWSIIVCAALGAPAHAQVKTDRFPLDRLRLATDEDGLINVEWGAVLKHGEWSALGWLEVQRNPVVLYQPVPGSDTGAPLGSLVKTRFDSSIGFAIGLWGRLQVGLDLPIAIHVTRDANVASLVGGNLGETTGRGPGDLRLVPKLQLLRAADHFVDLAVAATVTVPMPGPNYFEESTISFIPMLAITRAFAFGLRLGANFEYHMREDVQFLNLKVDDELSARLGAGFRFGADPGRPAQEGPYEVDMSLFGSTSAHHFREVKANDALELNTAVSYRSKGGWSPLVDLGFGLNAGYGTPDWRVVAGVRYSRINRDRDGDGIYDHLDQCPDQAEDKDGFEDADGCPDPDNDKDGVLDADDKCVNVPGPKENLGCPDTDKDGDGIVDRLDKCVDVPGVKELEGCPEPDRDKDGIIDRLDKCPDEPGLKELEGCQPPPPPPPQKPKQIPVVGKITFETNKDVILPPSFPVLDHVVKVMNENPEIHRVRIEGHTDDRGNDDKNLDLSQRRAESVKRYLIAKGIPADRLEAKGYGESRPITPKKTKKARDENRRVEFTILSKPIELPPLPARPSLPPPPPPQ